VSATVTEPRLPVGPFQQWVRTRLAMPGESIQSLAAHTGLSVRRLADIRDGLQATVRVDTVDRALLYSPTHLQELYPELYVFEEREA